MGVEKWFFQESFRYHPVYHCAARSIDRQLVYVPCINYNGIKKTTRVMREIILLKAILVKSSLSFMLSRKKLWFCLKLKFHHAESFNCTGEYSVW